MVVDEGDADSGCGVRNNDDMVAVVRVTKTNGTMATVMLVVVGGPLWWLVHGNGGGLGFPPAAVVVDLWWSRLWLQSHGSNPVKPSQAGHRRSTGHGCDGGFMVVPSSFHLGFVTGQVSSSFRVSVKPEKNSQTVKAADNPVKLSQNWSTG